MFYFTRLNKISDEDFHDLFVAVNLKYFVNSNKAVGGDAVIFRVLANSVAISGLILNFG